MAHNPRKRTWQLVFWAVASRRGDDSSSIFFWYFWLTIQNTANRQVRNLFLKVSWLYLSRFPEEPNPWLLGLGLLVPRKEPNLWLRELRLLVPRQVLFEEKKRKRKRKKENTKPCFSPRLYSLVLQVRAPESRERGAQHGANHFEDGWCCDNSAPGGVAAPKILPRDFLYCSRSVKDRVWYCPNVVQGV